MWLTPLAFCWDPLGDVKVFVCFFFFFFLNRLTVYDLAEVHGVMERTWLFQLEELGSASPCTQLCWVNHLTFLSLSFQFCKYYQISKLKHPAKHQVTMNAAWSLRWETITELSRVDSQDSPALHLGSWSRIKEIQGSRNKKEEFCEMFGGSPWNAVT